jgi:outer membrane protein OmpA-like peptidoglycan-associated protein
MTNPGSRVELQAFGGAKGDKGSDARRLSLKRALAIRQVLIEDGVNADRIDVHAMGGVDDTGPTDRVDVYVRT